jgi:hypothetical protein
MSDPKDLSAVDSALDAFVAQASSLDEDFSLPRDRSFPEATLVVSERLSRRTLITSIIASAAVSLVVVIAIHAAAPSSAALLRVRQSGTNVAAPPSGLGPIVTQLAAGAPELTAPTAASASLPARAGAVVATTHKGRAPTPKAGHRAWSTAFAD